MGAAPTIEVTSLDALDELLQDGMGAVVVELGSSRTKPARALERVFRALAEEFAGRPVTFARIEADRHPDLASEFKIRSIPTVVFCLDGEVVDAVVGRVDPERLRRQVEWLIGRAEGEGFFARLLRRRA